MLLRNVLATVDGIHGFNWKIMKKNRNVIAAVDGLSQF